MLCKVADRAYKARMALLIKNGEIVTADERYVADILCADETITRIEQNIPPPPGAEVVEAAGKYVFPGFIDPHTHSMEGVDRFSAERRKNIPALMQGVTTVTNSPDGRGPWDVARIQTETEQKGLFEF